MNVIDCQVGIYHTPYDVWIGKGSEWEGPWPPKVTGQGGLWAAWLSWLSWLMDQPHLIEKLPELRGKVCGRFWSCGDWHVVLKPIVMASDPFEEIANQMEEIIDSVQYASCDNKPLYREYNAQLIYMERKRKEQKAALAHKL